MMSIFSNSHREVRRASTLSILMLLLFSGAMPLSAAEPADEQSFSGPPVKQLSDLEPYTGYAAADRIVGDWRRKAYLLNFEQLAVNYGQNVDFQLREKQIILTPQTEEFLYQQYIPVPRYQAGSRPELEKITAAAVKNCRTTQEKVLALMRYCRDLKKRAKVSAGGKGWKYGGTEEELIAKGEDLCETLGRLFVALCEIEGIPARIVMHNIGGHITAEAYIDGEWGYLDPRFGIYFLKPDGKLASLRELMQNPSLTENQPAAVKAEAAGPYSHDQRAQASREKFFNPLLAGTVPVYRGAPNVRDFAPGEHCFVNVEAYDSPRALADFLNRCYADDDLYEQFYTWRRIPLRTAFVQKLQEVEMHPFIRLCRKVAGMRNGIRFDSGSL